MFTEPTTVIKQITFLLKHNSITCNLYSLCTNPLYRQNQSKQIEKCIEISSQVSLYYNQFKNNSSVANMNTSVRIIEVLTNAKNKCFSEGNITDGTDGTSSIKNGCRKIFDGLYCWPDTEPDTLSAQACTNDYIKSHNLTGIATKQCTSNGTWFESIDGPWTNLTQCVGIYITAENLDETNTIQFYEKWLPIIKYTAYVGYALSIFSVIIALSIFLNIRKLHCERNKLHIHLFVSILLRAVLFILKDCLFVKGTAMSNDVTFNNGQPNFNYTWMCKAFISVRYYVIIANFTFMLMEGLYLHNLIFLNLFSESHGTSIYCLLGWVLPIFFILPWMILRLFFENSLCWTQKDKKYIGLLLEIPIAVTVVINFVLFLIIIRVLIIKIHFTSTFIQQKKKKYRKLVKSTLILIPLYGMPYTISLLLSLYISKSKILEIVWLFFDQTFTSYQGLFAALVYCLLNTEVQNEVKRKYSALMNQSEKEFRRSRTISSNTQQFSLQNNDDALENLNLFGIVDDDTVKNVPQTLTTIIVSKAGIIQSLS